MAPKLKALVGGIIWTAVAAWKVSNLHNAAWAQALLLFAPLVLLPFALELAADAENNGRDRLWTLARRLQLPAALLLVAAFEWPAGPWATVLALPWLVFTGLVAAAGLRGCFTGGWGRPGALCRAAALVYLGVGGLWTAADRLALRPLGFDPAIVLLTAIHFHYAGFVLSLLAGWVVRERPGRAVARWAGLGVVVGVALVAAGITVAQIAGGSLLELVASWVLALSAVVIAGQQAALAAQSRWPPLVRGLWAIAAGSLVAGMALAALYGSRQYVRPWGWLDLPWMRALHGTVNTLGFGLAGVVGWWLAREPARLPPVTDTYPADEWTQ